MGAESSWGRHAKWHMLVVGAATTAPIEGSPVHLQSIYQENESIALVRFDNPTGHRFWMTEESRDALASAGPCPSSPCRRSPQYAAVLPAVLGANPVRGGAVVRSWGRFGTNGRTMMQSFDDSARADEVFDPLERTRRRRGYAPAVENR